LNGTDEGSVAYQISEATKNLATKGDTLSAYGIGDAYTKDEVNELFSESEEAL
jgi:hypothetical protein